LNVEFTLIITVEVLYLVGASY